MDGKVKTFTGKEAPPPFVKAINCVNCGAPIQVRAEGLSQICICSACGMGVDPATEAIIKHQENKSHGRQVIPLGTRGKIHGTLWEVIGYMERNDGGYYTWSEYLLFNPMKGFRWLAENNGHWSYVVMTKEKPSEVYTNRVKYGSKFYQLYHQGDAIISYIIGEFYWIAKTGEKVIVKDFVNNNEILSSEKSQDEIIWSISEYIEADTVKTAFKIKNMPAQIGVAPNQPCPISEQIQGIDKIWGYLVMTLFIIQLFTMFLGNAEDVYTNIFQFNRESSLGNVSGNVSVASESFEVKGRPSNLNIRLHSAVNNQWFAVQGELVNLMTGEQRDFDVGVEYYSGFDGEYWTEGSKEASINIPAVEAGSYQLNFEPSSDANNIEYELTVRRNVTHWSPFIWTLILLSFWPLWLIWRRKSFNMRKWADSDYSPYAIHNIEEE